MKAAWTAVVASAASTARPKTKSPNLSTEVEEATPTATHLSEAAAPDMCFAV